MSVATATVGGLADQMQDGTASVSNGGGRTYLSAIEVHRDGVITGFKFTQAAALIVKMSIWRAGTRVWQGDEVTKPAGTAILPCGFDALKGDKIGVTQANGTNNIEVTSYTGATLKYANDPSGTITDEASLTLSLANYVIDVAALGTTDFLCSSGDSICMGANSFAGHFDNPMGGTVTHQPGYVAARSLNWGFENHSDGSKTWAWAVTGGVPFALANNPTHLWLHFGVNDVAGGRLWSAIETDLDAVRALVPSTTRLFLTEILPWTAGNDTQAATIRTFNQNYATWCAANDATLILCHDAMGQVRGTTGELDDLISAYNSDGVHLTTAGVNAFAAIVEEVLASSVSQLVVDSNVTVSMSSVNVAGQRRADVSGARYLVGNGQGDVGVSIQSVDENGKRRASIR